MNRTSRTLNSIGPARRDDDDRRPVGSSVSAMPAMPARSIRVAALVASALLASQGVQAQQDDTAFGIAPGTLYAGAGYEFFASDGGRGLGDATIHALGLRGGYRISPVLGVEADLLFGIDDGEYDFDGEGDPAYLRPGVTLAEATATPGRLGLDYLAGLYVRASLPLTESVDLSARLGYAFAGLSDDGDLARLTTIDADGSDGGVSGGVSVSYDLDPSITLRIDFTRYNLDALEANGVGLFAHYRFGRSGR